MNHKTLKKAILTGLIASGLSAGICGVSFADQAIYAVEDGKQVASKTVYAFKPDSLYEVHCRVGYITDIKLKPGEAVSYSLVGDTSRWMFDQTTVGGVTHIYIKPMAEGIQTNLIVNSPTRSYRFVISEGPEEYSPIIEFTFEDEERRAMYSKPIELSPKQKLFNEIYTTNGQIDGRPILKKLNRQYEMKKKGNLDEDMLPTEVFDDGIRTYLKMPSSNKYDLPTLYLVEEDNKLTLVNYRVRDDYFVADRVFAKARLKYSAKTYVDIIAKENKDSEDNKDYEIAERLQNAVREAYADIKGETDDSAASAESPGAAETARKEAEMKAKAEAEAKIEAVRKAESEKRAAEAERLKALEKQKQEQAAAEIANLKRQVEAERKAREKAELDAANAEKEWRAQNEKAKQEQLKKEADQKAREAEWKEMVETVKRERLKEEAAKKAAEAKQAQKAADEARRIAEQAQKAANELAAKAAVPTVASTPVPKPVAVPAPTPTPLTPAKPVETKKLVPEDQKKVFNEIFNTNGKLDGKKVLEALKTKQETQKHGTVSATSLPKTVFTLENKTYFNMSKDYSGELPQIYVISGGRLIPVNYEVKGTYLIINGIVQKVRLQYSKDVYADITLVDGGNQ